MGSLSLANTIPSNGTMYNPRVELISPIMNGIPWVKHMGIGVPGSFSSRPRASLPPYFV